LAKSPQKDNSSYALKLRLRQNALAELGSIEPVVLESHAGAGKIFARCYSFVKEGMAFDIDPEKSIKLAKQRPTWAIFENRSEAAIQAGVGDHLAFNFIDIDPYGSPWPVVDAYWQSSRARPDKIVMVVNDGTRQGLAMKGGWEMEALREAVERHGNRLHPVYLAVAKEMMADKAAAAGYKMTRWTGYYTGYAKQMTHYAAVFERNK